jgi:hypothetical protein
MVTFGGVGCPVVGAVLCWMGEVFFRIPWSFWAYCLLLIVYYNAMDVVLGVCVVGLRVTGVCVGCIGFVWCRFVVRYIVVMSVG